MVSRKLIELFVNVIPSFTCNEPPISNSCNRSSSMVGFRSSNDVAVSLNV
jgi:hypothetical protein